MRDHVAAVAASNRRALITVPRLFFPKCGTVLSDAKKFLPVLDHTLQPAHDLSVDCTLEIIIRQFVTVGEVTFNAFSRDLEIPSAQVRYGRRWVEKHSLALMTS